MVWRGYPFNLWFGIFRILKSLVETPHPDPEELPGALATSWLDLLDKTLLEEPTLVELTDPLWRASWGTPAPREAWRGVQQTFDYILVMGNAE